MTQLTHIFSSPAKCNPVQSEESGGALATWIQTPIVSSSGATLTVVIVIVAVVVIVISFSLTYWWDSVNVSDLAWKPYIYTDNYYKKNQPLHLYTSMAHKNLFCARKKNPSQNIIFHQCHWRRRGTEGLAVYLEDFFSIDKREAKMPWHCTFKLPELQCMGCQNMWAWERN